MSEGLIALIYTCVVFLFLIFGVLFGLIRGFKKTLVRGLFLILTSLVIFGIAKLIVPIFGGINISGLGLEVEGVKQSTLSGFFSSQVSSWIDAGSTADIDGLTEVILSVSELIFSVFVFWILFIVCKYLLLPLNLLLYKLIFRGADEKEYARLKKMNKKMHGKVHAFVSGGDDFKITPINQGNPNQPNQGNNIYNPNQPSQANNNYNPNQSTIHSNFQQNKSSNGEYIPLDEYVPNFGVKEETIVEDLPCEKPSKRRLLGGLMGIPVGLFCGAMMLMPITGFMGVAKQINQYKAVAMESEEGYIQTITDGNFENIEEEYDSSIGNYVMTYSGANLLSNLTFDVLTTKKINGSKVKLSDDIVKTVETANEVVELTKVDFSSLNQSEMQECLETIDKLIDKAFQIGIVRSVVAGGKDLGVLILEKMDLKEYNILKTSALESLKSISVDNLSNELRGVVNLGKSLNAQLDGVDDSVLTTIVKGNDVVENLSKVGDEDIDAVVNSLFEFEKYKMQLTSSIIPELIEVGFNLSQDFINDFLQNEENEFVYSDKAENIREFGTKDELVSSVKVVLKNAVKVLKDVNDNVGGAIKNVGPILDELKNNKIISANTFNSLISAVEEYASRNLKDILKDVVSDEEIDELTSSISDVTNWTVELNKIGNAYLIFEENNSEESPLIPTKYDKLDIKNVKFESLGEILEEIAQTSILSRDKINDLIKSAVNDQFNQIGSEEKYQINGVDITFSKEAKEKLLKNIENINDFKNELLLVKELITGEEPIIDIENLNSDLFKNLDSIGKAIDKITKDTQTLNKSKIVTNDLVVLVAKDVFKEFLKTGEGLSDIDNAVNNLIEEIIDDNGLLDNAIKRISFSWEKELGKISIIKDLNFEDLGSIGESLDSIVDKDNPSLIITNTEIVKMVKTIINAYKTDGENLSAEEEAMNNFINSITSTNGTLDNAINNPAFSWAHELDIMAQVENINFSDFKLLGETLDNIVNKANPSLLITNIEIAGMVKEIFNGYKVAEPSTVEDEAINDFIDAITKAGGRLDLSIIEDEFSWENELTHLSNIKDIELDELEEVGEILDGIIYSEIPSLIIKNSEIANMIKTIINSYKADGENLSAEEMAVNNLIDAIILEEGTLSIAINNPAFRWENELDKISQIKDMSFSDLGIVGETLDTIVDKNNPSLLISNTEITNMIKIIIKDYKQDEDSAESKAINSVIDEILGFALDNAVTQEGFSWEVELSKMQAFSEVDLTGDYANIGNTLDGIIESSKIFSDKLVANMFSAIIDSYKIVSEEEFTVIENAVNQFIDDINSKLAEVIDNNFDIIWENELENMEQISALTVEDDILSCGNAMENASKNSIIITDSLIAKMFKTVIENYKFTANGENLSDNENAINSFLDTIEVELNKDKDFNWAKEFGHVGILRDQLETLASIGSENIGDLETLGSIIDGIALNYGEDEVKNSDIITKIAVVELMEKMVKSLEYKNLEITDEDYAKKILINNFLNGDIDGDSSNDSNVGISFDALKEDSFDWAVAKNEEVGKGFKWANEFNYINEVISAIENATGDLTLSAQTAILEVINNCNIVVM